MELKGRFSTGVRDFSTGRHIMVPGGQPFCISVVENIPEFTTGPGWFTSYDSTIGYVYRPGETVSTLNSTAVAATNDKLVEITGARFIKFLNIKFEHTTWTTLINNPGDGYCEWYGGVRLVGSGCQGVASFTGMVSVHNSDHLVFQGNFFARSGTAGLSFDAGTTANECNNITITGNKFSDISGPAIFAGTTNPSPAVQSSSMNINNNYLVGAAQEYFSAAALFLSYTRGASIVHNEISGANYAGISFGWGLGCNDDSCAGIQGTYQAIKGRR